MRGLVFTVAAAAALSAPALAAHPPTTAERSAILVALPHDVQEIPVKCVRIVVRVANSRTYATATPHFLNATHQPCLKYASNGYWILAKHSGRWKVVFNGSELPRCSLHVPRDLIHCLS